jgi:hypothetical protein
MTVTGLTCQRQEIKFNAQLVSWFSTYSSYDFEVLKFILSSMVVKCSFVVKRQLFTWSPCGVVCHSFSVM